MPNISEKEKRLTENLKRLSQKELEAYRFFIKDGQMEISEPAAEEMYDLYFNGSSCDEIRKALKGYSFGQIVAARVIYNWDERKIQQKIDSEKLPEKNVDKLLEAQEFLGDLIVATNKRFKAQLKRYIATGELQELQGIPLPKNIKDFQILIDLFMKATGQDKKETTQNVNVTVKHQEVKKEIAADEDDSEMTLDELLGITDVEFEEVPVKQLEAIQNAN